MLDPLDFENRPYIDALAKKRRATFFILLIEYASLFGWRLFFWLLLFAGLWMLEIPQFFGLVGKYAAWLIFAGGMIYVFRKDIMRFSAPKTHIVDQRLERESRILQGSLLSLDDRLANPKKHETRDLWSVAQKQILKNLTDLKIPKPAAFMVRKDPWALRFIAVLLFISGIFVSGADWNNRIWGGLVPFSIQLSSAEPKNINLWIKPPEYTGLAQVHLIGGDNLKEPLKIPQGSELKIRVYNLLGKFLAPTFRNGQSRQPMKYVGEGLYSLDTAIQSGSSLAVSQGFIPRAHWNYDYIEDLPPTIALTSLEEKKTEAEQKSEDKKEESPKGFEILPNMQLRFGLSVEDDYSVTDLNVTMHLDPMVEDIPMGEDFKDTRLVMSPPATAFKISPVYDLTWHTWAGLPVVFEFEVKDHKGQSAKLAPIKLILPERSFEHPVAKSLIASRKKLAWSKDHDFMTLSNDLQTLLLAPDFFQNNPVVYLAIKTAGARLRESDTLLEAEKLETTKALLSLLWDTAIAVEDGNLSLALRELRDAQKALENALRDPNTPKSEIDRLTENLQDKMMEYFSELQREMQKRMAEGQQFQTIPPDQLGQIISPESLSKFMEQLQSELQSGNKDKAQEMLSQLQRMMDMMDPSMTAPMPQDMQMMSEGVSELEELIQRQEALLDQTQDQAELQNIFKGRENSLSKILPPNLDILKEFGMEGAPPPPAQKQNEMMAQDKAPDTQKNKAEQEALRYVLGQLMMDAGEILDEIPEGMGKAEQEMRGSEKTLGANDPKGSIPHQEKAIEHLKQSQEQLSKQLQQRMQQMVGIGLSGGMRYDPLGRPYGGQQEGNGPLDDQNVKIPKEAQKKRVEEILKILRDRSGEFDRPSEELEYYRRLLRQF